MDVAILRWPEDASVRAQLELLGRPRLLLVDRDSAVPEVVDSLEDWTRVPVADDEIRARVATLQARAATAPRTKPLVDGDGVLHFEGRWISLPPVESRLGVLLVDRFGALVRRDDLEQAGWPDGVRDRNALDVRMVRLRRRVESLGLTVRTVRSRGFVLQRADS